MPNRPAKPLPLTGATVVVTRPTAAAATLKRRAAALGAAVVALPGLSLRGADDPRAAARALRAARTADAAIFVSPAAVRHAALLAPLAFSRRTTVFAVGAATARALRRRGISAQHPQRQDSEGLLALPALARVRGKRVALIGAPGGREALPRALRRRGAAVERVDVYRRAPARLDGRHLRVLEAARPPLLVLVSSAEILDNLQRALPAAAFTRLAGSEIVVGSARLAILAQAAGCRRVHVARSAESAALLAGAISALAQHRL
ncbi:MAG TPA: uroporphyrinogen-III synthase [Rudaea sp.]|nr:uroporphyrinogen-III synthase [Rudaea sp.]